MKAKLRSSHVLGAKGLTIGRPIVLGLIYGSCLRCVDG